MKNIKITAEEQGTGNFGKLSSERKACRRKWLATLCLSSGDTSALHGIPTVFGIRYVNDFVNTTQVQDAVNTF